MEMADFVSRTRAGEIITSEMRLSDKPTCVRPVVAAFLRTWNDALDDDDRARLITPELILLALDTHTTDDDDRTAAWLAVDWIVRVHAPPFFELAGLGEHAATLRALAPIVDDDSAEMARGPVTAARTAAVRMADAADVAVWAAVRMADDAADAAVRRAAAKAAVASARALEAEAASAAASAAWAAAATSWAWAKAEKTAAAAEAWSILSHTVAELQLSAVDLVQRMCAVGR